MHICDDFFVDFFVSEKTSVLLRDNQMPRLEQELVTLGTDQTSPKTASMNVHVHMVINETAATMKNGPRMRMAWCIPPSNLSRQLSNLQTKIRSLCESQCQLPALNFVGMGMCWPLRTTGPSVCCVAYTLPLPLPRPSCKLPSTRKQDSQDIKRMGRLRDAF
jgi:hypothetical protein